MASLPWPEEQPTIPAASAATKSGPRIYAAGSGTIGMPAPMPQGRLSFIRALFERVHRFNSLEGNPIFEVASINAATFV